MSTLSSNDLPDSPGAVKTVLNLHLPPAASVAPTHLFGSVIAKYVPVLILMLLMVSSLSAVKVTTLFATPSASTSIVTGDGEALIGKHLGAASLSAPVISVMIVLAFSHWTDAVPVPPKDIVPPKLQRPPLPVSLMLDPSSAVTLFILCSPPLASLRLAIAIAGSVQW